MVNDRSKGFLTLIGGTANQEEYNFATKAVDYNRVLKREIKEESVQNITLTDDFQFQDIAKVRSKTPLFGNRLDDTCIFKYGVITTEHKFLELVLSNGGSVDMDDKEIEKFILWKIPDPNSLEQETMLGKVQALKESFGKIQPSFMMLFMALKKVWKISMKIDMGLSNEISEEKEIKKMVEMGFPRALQGVDFY